MKITKQDVENARECFNGGLGYAGICDEVTLKVKPYNSGRHHEWVGLYRGLSQFRSRPIFWINEDIESCFPDGVSPCKAITKEAICDTCLHEYGHVIAEWGMKRNKKIDEKIHSCFRSDEDFAESFMDYANGKNQIISWSERACIDDIISEYLKDLPELRCKK